MHPDRKWLIVALLGLMPVLGGAAEKPVKLNVKPGLWEIASETQMTGLPALPKELLEKLTTEQLDAMKAMIKAQADKGPISDVAKECVTPEDLEEPFKTQDIQNCEQTSVANTSTRQEMRLVCMGERTGSGFLRINAPTPEAMTGEFELNIGSGAEAMKLTSHLKGKWIGSDCGDAAGDKKP